MTVRTLTQDQKDAIATIHKSKTKTQKEIAQRLGVSERTINRVLNEMGLLTAVPRLKGEAHQALSVLEAWNIKPADLQDTFAQLEDMGVFQCMSNITTIGMPAPTREQIIAAAVNMEDGTWSALLNDILTARVAAQHTQHVQTAMLNLQQKADASAKSNKKS